MRDSDLLRAEAELIRFLRREWSEARRLGYPTMSAFAKDIARGTLAPAAQEVADPVQDAVGRFYYRLALKQMDALHQRYIVGLSDGRAAKKLGIARETFNRRVRRIIRGLSGYLVKYT